MAKKDEVKVVGAAALLAAAAMAGCGRGVVGPAPALRAGQPQAQAASSRLLPTQVGTTWSYAVVASPVDDPEVDEPGTDRWEVVEAKAQGKATLVQLRGIDSYTERYRFPSLLVDEAGVRLQGVGYWGPNPEVIEGFQVPLLQFPLTAGAKWDDGAYMTTVGATEAVQVPAGRFQAVKLSFIGTAPNALRSAKPGAKAKDGGAHYTGVGTLWFAPGVGVVKGEVNDGAWIFESELQALPRPAR